MPELRLWYMEGDATFPKVKIVRHCASVFLSGVKLNHVLRHNLLAIENKAVIWTNMLWQALKAMTGMTDLRENYKTCYDYPIHLNGVITCKYYTNICDGPQGKTQK